MHHFLIIAITLTVNADALPSKKNIAVENDTARLAEETHWEAQVGAH